MGVVPKGLRVKASTKRKQGAESFTAAWLGAFLAESGHSRAEIAMEKDD
jgi:hypothetical protein